MPFVFFVLVTLGFESEIATKVFSFLLCFGVLSSFVNFSFPIIGLKFIKDNGCHNRVFVNILSAKILVWIFICVAITIVVPFTDFEYGFQLALVLLVVAFDREYINFYLGRNRTLIYSAMCSASITILGWATLVNNEVDAIGVYIASTFSYVLVQYIRGRKEINLSTPNKTFVFKLFLDGWRLFVSTWSIYALQRSPVLLAMGLAPGNFFYFITIADKLNEIIRIFLSTVHRMILKKQLQGRRESQKLNILKVLSFVLVLLAISVFIMQVEYPYKLISFCFLALSFMNFQNIYGLNGLYVIGKDGYIVTANFISLLIMVAASFLCYDYFELKPEFILLCYLVSEFANCSLRFIFWKKNEKNCIY
ncbi:hypothetical protein [Vibrio nomapromontoriensis]|uniref:hypothetical protein n=1 Tax=Vibrio nomapromontoriensis TaxID=2910246 RepID=UPI003D149CEE